MLYGEAWYGMTRGWSDLHSDEEKRGTSISPYSRKPPRPIDSRMNVAQGKEGEETPKQKERRKKNFLETVCQLGERHEGGEEEEEKAVLIIYEKELADKLDRALPIKLTQRGHRVIAIKDEKKRLQRKFCRDDDVQHTHNFS